MLHCHVRIMVPSGKGTAPVRKMTTWLTLSASCECSCGPTSTQQFTKQTKYEGLRFTKLELLGSPSAHWPLIKWGPLARHKVWTQDEPHSGKGVPVYNSNGSIIGIP